MLQIFSIDSALLGATWATPQYLALQRMAELQKKSGVHSKKLGELADISSGLYVKKYSDSGVSYLRVDNIRVGILNLSIDDVVKVSYDDLETIPSRCMTSYEDVLIARTGTLGKASLIVTKDQQGVVLSQHLTRLSVKERDTILPGYLCLFLNCNYGKMQLINSGMGSTRLELTHASLGNLDVPLLPLGLQEEFHDRFKKALDRYYNCVRQMEECIFKVNELLEVPTAATAPLNHGRPNTFDLESNDLRTIWIPRNYDPHKLKQLSYIEDRFELVSLGKMASIRRGKGSRVGEYETVGIPFIRTSSIINGFIDPFPDHYASASTYVDFAQIIGDGDILFSIEGKIGATAILTGKFPVVFKNHIEQISVDQPTEGFKREELAGWVYLVLLSSFGRAQAAMHTVCLLYTSPSPRDRTRSRMPSSA